MFSKICIVLIVLCALFIIYTLLMCPTFDTKSKSESLPQPYGWIYGVTTTIPFLANWVHSMEDDLSLYYGSKAKGKIYCSVFVTLIPLITIILDLVIVLLIDIWYYALAGVIFGSLYPLLFVSNMIKKKADFTKEAMIKYYEACERYFADKIQVSEAFLRCEEAAGGAVKKIFSSFNATYYVDKMKAYEEFVRIVGDIYGRSFITTVLAYDEDGADPCATIQGIVSMATRDYHLKAMCRGRNKQYKLLAGGVIGIAIMFSFSASDLIAVAGTSASTGSIFTYLSILICLFVLLVCEFYEMR